MAEVLPDKGTRVGWHGGVPRTECDPSARSLARSLSLEPRGLYARHSPQQTQLFR
jgi:hypothetical protein